eukprot:15483896-Alexandrium_andersonii.AAC.1
MLRYVPIVPTAFYRALVEQMQASKPPRNTFGCVKGRRREESTGANVILADGAQIAGLSVASVH